MNGYVFSRNMSSILRNILDNRGLFIVYLCKDNSKRVANDRCTENRAENK
jgi:hypothetical protein